MALTALSAAVRKMSADLVVEAAARFDELAQASASRVVGGGATMRMHTGKGRRPVKMGTKTSKLFDRGDTVSIYVNGTPKGPWVWIEDGTRAHEIGRGRRHLKLGDDWVIGPIRHPGSRGQRAWSRAVKEFKVEYPQLAIRQIKKKVARG